MCSYLFYSYIWIQIIIAVLPFYAGVLPGTKRPFWLVGFFLYANITGPSAQNVAHVFSFTVTSNIYRHGYEAIFSEWSNWWLFLVLICTVMHSRSSQGDEKKAKSCKVEDDGNKVVLDNTLLLVRRCNQISYYV